MKRKGGAPLDDDGRRRPPLDALDRSTPSTARRPRRPRPLGARSRMYDERRRISRRPRRPSLYMRREHHVL